MGGGEDRLQGGHFQQVWLFLLSAAFSVITKDNYYLILNLFCRVPGCQGLSVQTNVGGFGFMSPGSKRLPESRPSPSRMMCDRDLTPEGYTSISSLNLRLQAQKPAVVSGVTPEATFPVQVDKVGS